MAGPLLPVRACGSETPAADPACRRADGCHRCVQHRRAERPRADRGRDGPAGRDIWVQRHAPRTPVDDVVTPAQATGRSRSVPPAASTRNGAGLIPRAGPREHAAPRKVTTAGASADDPDVPRLGSQREVTFCSAPACRLTIRIRRSVRLPRRGGIVGAGRRSGMYGRPARRCWPARGRSSSPIGGGLRRVRQALAETRDAQAGRRYGAKIQIDQQGRQS